MKLITLEEHYADPQIQAAGAARQKELCAEFSAGLFEITGPGAPAPGAAFLRNIDARLGDMDKFGITMQVLSGIGAPYMPADVAPELARNANDAAAAVVRAHPDRFAAFAALPITVPDAAATELNRCVTELGFVGTLIDGRVDDEFLSEPRFDAVLATAHRLCVPIYLHPGLPPVATVLQNYGGLNPNVSARLETAAWGWHVDAGTHFLQLVLTGVFDRYPDLQIILGHWGEILPFYIDRMESTLPRSATGLDRTISEYFRQNAYITPSGMFNQANLQYCVDTIGIDRILYSNDYPMISLENTTAFLEAAKLSVQDKHLIAHGNAERLLHL